MRCRQRLVLIASALVAGLALAGCESFDPESIFSNKKPLPGDRRAVFPEGVPGVPQGVPAELMKGDPASPPAAGPQVVQAEKPKPKPKPKPKQAAAPPPPGQDIDAQPAPRQPRRGSAQQQPGAGPEPQPQPRASQANRSQTQSPFPDPPPAGTFSR